MSDLVERVAREMCLANHGDPDEVMENDGPRWLYWVPNARAAIKAVAEWLDDNADEQFVSSADVLRKALENKR